MSHFLSICPGAWKVNPANFAFTEISEVPRTAYAAVRTIGLPLVITMVCS
jgi:hypothetical protein